MPKKTMPKRLTIEITGGDIRNGQRGSPYSCPIAMSLGRVAYDRLGQDVDHIAVSTHASVYVKDRPAYHYRLTGKTLKFLCDFDDYGGKLKVKPGRYTFYLSEAEWTK